jgi:hypothetical protein
LILNSRLIFLPVLFVCTCIAGAAEKIDRQEVLPGLEYIHKTVSDVPWSIFVLKVNRTRKDLGIVTTLPYGGKLGLTRLSDQIPFIPERVGKGIGGINGDFFSWRKGPYQGDPAGVQIMNGELVSGPHVPPPNERGTAQGAVAFWIDARNQAHIEVVESSFAVTFPNGKQIPFRMNAERGDNEAMLYTYISGSSTRTTNGVELLLERSTFSRWLPLQVGENYRARVASIGTTNTPLNPHVLVLSIAPKLLAQLPPLKPGMTLRISTATRPNLKGAVTAIGGAPILVRNGKPSTMKDPQRHPKTAVGFNDTHYFLVVVDGRRTGVSEGMTNVELAKEMRRLGCSDAMNLDGGGSAMMWLNGELKSQPSDNRGERPNANSLIVVQRPASSLKTAPRGELSLQNTRR